MLIKKIELTNWGPHRSLKVDLLANVVGVIGGNGKGKSNFLQAIDYGLNGNLNKQNKELYIYNFGKEDGATKATVHIEFAKDGKDGEITRTITKSSSTRKLIWEGNTYTSDADVSSQMSKILGADKAAMANAVFIKQGCLGTLIKGTPAERQSIFQKLMNLSFLDSRDNDIKNKIDKLKQGITDYRPTLDMLSIQRKELLEQLQALDKQGIKDPFGCTRGPDIMTARAALKRAESYFMKCAANAAATYRARGDKFVAEERLKTTLTSLGYASLEALSADALAAQTQEKLLERANEKSSLQSGVLSTEKRIKEAKEALPKLQAQVMPPEQLKALDDEVANMQYESTRRHNQAIETSNLLRLKGKYAAALEDVKTASIDLTVAKEAADNLAGSETLISAREKKAHTLRLRLQYLTTTDQVEATCPICGNHIRELTADEREVAIFDTKDELEKNEAALTRLKKLLTETQDNLRLAQYNVSEKQAVANKLLASISELTPDNSEVAFSQYSDEELIIAIRKKRTDLIKAYSIPRDIEQTEQSIISMTTLKESYEKRLEALQDVPEAYSVEEMNAIKDRAVKLTAALSTAKSADLAVQVAENTLHTCERNEASIEATAPAIIESLQAAIPNFSDEDFCEEVIATMVEQDKEYSQRLAEYFAVRNAKKEELTAINLKIAETEAKVEAEQERLQLIDDLETVRKITGKGGLPLAYMNTVFDRLTGIVQEILGKMGANFTVFKDEERPCSFRFTRLDDTTGYSMPQEMLSGGQAIRLSLALLIACQRLILPEVGLLVLDEPSSHMDAEGVDSLQTLFKEMSSLFRSCETQLVIVDHNPALIAALEKVVCLE